jgi:hypothetical protein
MFRRLVALLVASGAGIAAFGGAHAGAHAAVPPDAVGADVSHPQCPVFAGQPFLGLPGTVRFAVVGVNDGVATATNPCLAGELAWAAQATGGRIGSRIALYVNTADPGTASARWPRSGAGPYGSCEPGDAGPACAYAYGSALARDDLARVPAPAGTRWWLDVESANTWSGTRLANRAVLEGMADALGAAGARPGLYANRTDWAAIIGRVPASSPLHELPTWLAGATTRAGALENCSHPTLPGGGRIELAQFLPLLGTVDLDVRCPRSPADR